MALTLQALLGIVVFCAIAWLAGTARRAVRWRGVVAGLALQFALCALLLHAPGARFVFDVLNRLVVALQAATTAGTGFVFGYLGGGPAPFEITQPAHDFVLAFRALPLVLVIGALTSLLIYWRVLPLVVRLLGLLLERVLGIGAALSFGCAANVFLGMVEAPLFIKPWLTRLTRSELFVLLVSGMATIAGTVMMLYASILAPVVPDAVGHLLVASIVSVPAAVVMAQLMVPETATPTRGDWRVPRGADSAIEAIANGTQTGLQLCLQIVAMLVVLVALVHLFNLALALLPAVGGEALTLQRMLGWLMAPLAWLMGIPWSEAPQAGRLLGIKTVLNELLAYLELARAAPATFGERTRIVLTYAMCGFANIGSLGILIAGIGEMAPTRRAEVLSLGPRAVLAGTLATLSTGAVVGVLL
ncbi:MAG: NupC/NupG family nucleoside CNT transporter [Gammaproteobacteria bacterium]